MKLPIIYMDVIFLAVILVILLVAGVLGGRILERRRNRNVPNYQTLLYTVGRLNKALATECTAIQGHIGLLGEGLPVDEQRWQISRDAILQSMDEIQIQRGRIPLILEGFQTRISVSPVNLARLIEQILIRLEPVATEKDITLRLEMNQQIAPVPGETRMLKEIITSLLDNAIKYNPRGTEVVAELGSQNGMALVRISDNGVGIREDLLPIIFEPEVRDVGPGAPPGTGLGLSIAKTLTELHGGSIKVESQVGQGTVFSIALPFERPDDTRENKVFSRWFQRLRI